MSKEDAERIMQMAKEKEASAMRNRQAAPRNNKPEKNQSAQDW